MENVALAGRGSEYAYQEAKNLKELARDIVKTIKVFCVLISNMLENPKVLTTTE